MWVYLWTFALLLGLLLGGVLVERLYRRFAARNPHLGPFREPEHKCGSCSGGSGCGGDSCSREGAASPTRHTH